MANPSRISTLILSGAGGSRTWTATAATQDTAAGAAVTITLATSTTGVTPPTQENGYSLQLLVDNTSTVVRTYTPGIPMNGTVSFSFTVDGQVGSAARAGLLRMVINVVQNSGLAASQYSGNSDSGGTPPTGYTFTQTDSGYIRGTTTATTTLNQATYAYGDTITATTTLGAAPFINRTVNVAFGGLTAVASASSTTVTFTTAQGTTDNRFPAASGSKATVTTIPNASLVALPWVALTSATEASATVDPRITFTHLHQDNDNVFGTPPTSKEVGAQRLASNLAFLSARVVNAAGVGVNGVTWTTSLQDAGALTTAQTRSVTSSTQGGQVGWGQTFLSWADQLPTGNWVKTNTITAPSSATGLEVGNSVTYQLVAANPNYRIVCAGGPATVATDARHFSPGVPLLCGIAVFNTQTMRTMALDTSPSPAIALGRFNLALGRAEFLDSDEVWKATNGVNIYYWPCTVSAGDSNVWTVTFSDTTTWSVADLFIIGRCYIGGVPVNDFMKEITVNGINNHDKYAFDGAGFVGFPNK